LKEVSRPADPEKGEKFDSLIHNMKGEIQRVSRFAESFLEYGRPFELNRRETDIGKIIEDVIELVSAKAGQEKVHIRKEYGSIPTLRVDPEFIKTCFYNIITNALEAMHGGGVLSIRAGEADEKFFLTVEDTGTGVPQEMMPKVFEPFFTTKSRGLGLGLAFTQRIIKEHGGKVTFESAEGKGSIVTIFLPVEKGH
jgi:signal transduction histidine kinase